jgi:hypothetical protein
MPWKNNTSSFLCIISHKKFRVFCFALASRRETKNKKMPEEISAHEQRLVQTIVGVLTSQREHEVVVYCANLRHAKRLLLAVYRRLNPSRIVSLNKNESLRFRAADDSVNSLFAFPTNAQTLRGTGTIGAGGDHMI